MMLFHPHAVEHYLGGLRPRGHGPKGRSSTRVQLRHAVGSRSQPSVRLAHAHARAGAVHAWWSPTRHEHARGPPHARASTKRAPPGGHPLGGGLHVHARGRPTHGPSRAHAAGAHGPLRGAATEGRPPPLRRHATTGLPWGTAHELGGHAARWPSHARPWAWHTHGPRPGAHEVTPSHGALQCLHAP